MIRVIFLAVSCALAALLAGCVAPGPEVVVRPHAVPGNHADLIALSQDVYVDPATGPGERDQIRAAYARAVREVETALGPRSADPPIALFCKEDPCRAAFGGSSRSRGIRPGEKVPWGTYTPGGRAAVLIVAVGPGMEGLLVHEMVHVEIGARARPGFIPSWFDEGIATLVAEAPDCRRQFGRGVDDLRRLDSATVLGAYTDVPRLLIPVYCQARAEVDAWLRRFGRHQLFSLLAAVRSGGDFYDAYGSMLTQSAGPVRTLIVSSAPSLGDPRHPFSLAMWIKPRARSGVLAHLSAHPEGGGGWCTPFVGFDSSGHLVAQLLHGAVPSSYAIATTATSITIGKWTHVAMTWAPGSPIRLYIDGTVAAEAASPGGPGAASPLYVAWGSSNAGGAECWQGAIDGGAFQGSMTEMAVFDTALDAARVSQLAARGAP